MNGQTVAARAAARQNLLMAALDAAYARGLVIDDDQHRSFQYEVIGRPALGCVRSDSSEIFVTSILSPTAFARERFACCGLSGHRRPLFGDACVTGWVDKYTGQFFKISGGYHASYDATAALAKMTITKERQASSHRYNMGRIGDARPARA